MRVQIAKWGNSSAIRLPKPLVEELGLKPGQEVDLTVEGKEVRMTPVKPRFVYRIEDLVAEMRRLGPDDEPPVEDWSPVEAPWPDVPLRDR